MIDQSIGESLMRWTVRLAVACVLLRTLVRLRYGSANSRSALTTECWLIWMLDQARMIVACIIGRLTSRTMDLASFVVVAFNVFNATVEFGAVAHRWIAIPVFLAMLFTWRRGDAAKHDEMLESSSQ